MNDQSATEVVTHMMQNDFFSQWLGIEILEVKEGYSKIKMLVRKEMLNGFGIVHGGLAFSLGDTAFAFACNNRNNISVALDVTITFTKPVNVGDVLTADLKKCTMGKVQAFTSSLFLIKRMRLLLFLKEPVSEPRRR